MAEAKGTNSSEVEMNSKYYCYLWLSLRFREFELWYVVFGVHFCLVIRTIKAILVSRGVPIHKYLYGKKLKFLILFESAKDV